MIKYVAYCRRSTNTKQQQKHSLESQHAEITEFINEKGGTIIKCFNEVQSGTIVKREKLLQAIELCEQTGATLIVSKLSRLSRDIGQVNELYNSSLKIVIVEFGIEVQYETILMFGVMNALMVKNLKKAIRRGIKTSREKGTIWNKLSPNAQKLGRAAASNIAHAKRSELGPILHGLRLQGLSNQDVSDTMNLNGIKTSRGKKWHRVIVYQTLKRWRTDEGITDTKIQMELP